MVKIPAVEVYAAQNRVRSPGGAKSLSLEYPFRPVAGRVSLLCHRLTGGGAAVGVSGREIEKRPLG